MKYNAEVDSEKRNKSPRNDLLRNRKCVGIIQAAKNTHRHVCVSTTTRDQFRCVQMPGPVVRGRSGLNEPSGVVGLRQRRGTTRLGSQSISAAGRAEERTSNIQSIRLRSMPERVVSLLVQRTPDVETADNDSAV